VKVNVDPYQMRLVERVAGGAYCRTRDIFNIKPSEAGREPGIGGRADPLRAMYFFSRY